MVRLALEQRREAFSRPRIDPIPKPGLCQPKPALPHECVSSMLAEYRDDQEKTPQKEERVAGIWKAIGVKAEANPLYLKVKDQLQPMDLSDGKPRSSSVEGFGVNTDGAKSFDELTKSNQDGVRRKSMMPSNKKAED